MATVCKVCHININYVSTEVTADVPTIKSTACSSTIGDVSIKFHGGASWLYNIFDHYVEKALKSNLQDTVRGIL